MFGVEKPLPRPTEDSAPFWEAAAKGELRMQRCSDATILLATPGGVPRAGSTAPAIAYSKGEMSQIFGAVSMASYRSLQRHRLILNFK